jgi:hypothetical protein
MPLSDYIQDTSALLHDYSLQGTPEKQVVRWINEARRQCAQRSGCIRRLVTGQSAFGASAQPGVAVPGGMQPGSLPNAFSAFTVNGAASNPLQTIPGQERYPYVGFFNPVLQAEYAGCDRVIDTIALSVNWGGAIRPTLAWLPWDDFQAYGRAYATLVTSYPYYWSVYNDGEDGEIWMFPAPSTTGDIELDAYVIPSDIWTNEDYDAIPRAFRNTIKFGAASLAFQTTYRYQIAQVMENQFADRLGVSRVAVDRGKTSNYYWNVS